MLAAVWLTVGIVLAARYVLSWTRTRRAVACAIPLGRDDPRYAPLPRCARLREGPMEGAPLTFGAVKPTVVLSPGLDGDALDCVLAHEGVHARRRDNLWHYVMALALVVHWWNPAVWLMARLLRRDIELSCDQAALRKLGAERRADYANTLVTLATQGDGPAFCQTFGRKAAEERIRSVMKFKKTSVIGVVLSLVLVLAVTAAFASEPKEPDTYDSVKVDTSVTLSETLTGDAAKYASQLHAGMTRDEVHQVLGEPSFSMSRPYSDSYELDDTQKPQLGFFYDVDGTVIQVKYFSDGTDPGGTGIDLTPFLTASDEDQPNYVDPDGAIDPDSTNGGYTLIDYDVKLPTFDEDGSSISADGGITGTRFDYCKVEWVGPASDDVLRPFNVYALRPSSGTYALCTARDCEVPYGHCHLDGKVFRVYYEDPGLLCAQPDCGIEEPHEHDGVWFAGRAGDFVVLDPEMEPVPSAAPVSGEHHSESHHSGEHH